MSYTPNVAESQKRYRATEKGSRKHRDYMRDYMLAYRERRKQSSDYNPEEERRKWREQHQRLSEKAIEQLGGKQCANYGCDEFNLLEINHLNGGGQQQKSDRTANSFGTL